MPRFEDEFEDDYDDVMDPAKSCLTILVCMAIGAVVWALIAKFLGWF